MSCQVHAVIAAAGRARVTINGVAIPHDAISREVQNHPAHTPVAAWNAAARALAVRELLLQEARRLELMPEPTIDDEGRRETVEEALVRLLIEREVVTPVPNKEDCRRYYDNNHARFRSADIHEASHILVAARRSDPAAFAAARARALTLLAYLQAEEHTFADLAKAHSDCPSAAAKGNLGQLTSGATTPPFERALLQLEAGEISREPVETDYGFHIIRLDRRIDGALLPFEFVCGKIAEYLKERTRRIALAQYVARLAARAQIIGVEMPTPGDLRVH
jgi:peptidyl-prolyl cis-trans isomerase C